MGIKIKSFAIEKADCFLIKIEDGKKYFNLMVDCGKNGLYSDIQKELGSKRLNGVVVTHVDNDHIMGVIDLLENNFPMKDTFIIYNKYDESLISYEAGRRLHEQIKEQFGEKLLIKSYAGNYHRENNAIKRRTKSDNLPVQILSKKQRLLRKRSELNPKTVYITMLSPNIDILKTFMRNWSKKRVSSRITNRSSIVFLLEFDQKSVLMLGDAYVSDLEGDLDLIRGLEHIDYIKIAHHGAEVNNRGLENIVKKYKCRTAVVTMAKKQKNKKSHPSRQVIEKIEEQGCTIFTSTNYVCADKTDIVNHVIVQGEVEI